MIAEVEEQRMGLVAPVFFFDGEKAFIKWKPGFEKLGELAREGEQKSSRQGELVLFGLHRNDRSHKNLLFAQPFFSDGQRVGIDDAFDCFSIGTDSAVTVKVAL